MNTQKEEESIYTFILFILFLIIGKFFIFIIIFIHLEAWGTRVLTKKIKKEIKRLRFIYRLT